MSPSIFPDASRRGETLHLGVVDELHRRTDRLFAGLMVIQWLFGVAVALVYSRYTWSGLDRTQHLHVPTAIILGGIISALPIALVVLRPGKPITRHVIAAAQMLWSALLIHLCGGRIETHFHIFGSLAFLAFYRDWKVLVPATLVVATDHFVRGLLWPESIYGMANPEWWRFLEHAFWVVFEDAFLIRAIVISQQEMKALSFRQAELEVANENVEALVAERTKELASSREEYRSLLETTQAIPWEMLPGGELITYVGPQAADLLGEEVWAWKDPGFLREHVHVDDAEVVQTLFDLAVGEDIALDFRLRRADGAWVWTHTTASAVDSNGFRVVRAVTIDITEQKQMEAELHQAQKLESVGRLAAGVAHEINTPIQFVSDSLTFVEDSVGDLKTFFATYQQAKEQIEGGVVAELDEAEEDADLEFVLDNLPAALTRSAEGLSRVAKIVRSMKEFAHPDQKEMSMVDLGRALESTLTIARHEYKYVADLETDIQELPPVRCYLGEINQVVLNLIINASHAVGDVVAESGDKGLIRLEAWADGSDVCVSIRDTGGGIPEKVKERMFDPFFTTKEVGKGTGQGLAIARSVIEKHAGSLDVETEVGVGTTFTIRIPAEGSELAESAAA